MSMPPGPVYVSTAWRSEACSKAINNCSSSPRALPDLALPEQRQDLALAAINQRGETIADSYTAVSDEAAAASGGKERQLDTYGEVHSFCTNLHKSGVGCYLLDCRTLPRGWC